MEKCGSGRVGTWKRGTRKFKKRGRAGKKLGASSFSWILRFSIFLLFFAKIYLVEVLFFYSRFFKFLWNFVTTVMGSFVVAPLVSVVHSSFWKFFFQIFYFWCFFRCVVFFENIFLNFFKQGVFFLFFCW